MSPWLPVVLLVLVLGALGLGLVAGDMTASLIERSRRREERRRARRRRSSGDT